MLRKSIISITVSTLSFGLQAQTINEYFLKIQNDSIKLHEFLYQMPKGGDLHNHHGGSSMAENMIQYALKDKVCVDTNSLSIISDPACRDENKLENFITSPNNKTALIDAWSMQDFHEGKETGHDHFFNSFKKYGLITSQHPGEVLTEIVDRAGKQNEVYMELMITPDKNNSGMLGKKLGWNPNLEDFRQQLLGAGLEKIMSDASKKIDQDEKFLQKELNCGTAKAGAGCNVKLRYLYQVFREQPPEQVFAQLLGGFELANKDPRVVGINMVQPEDGPISMRDYDLQMQMVGFLHKLYPHVHISLHAGELVPGLVSDDGLRFHIRDAVEIAKAERIGHGVDINHETNMNQLLTEMSRKHIAVEINLTSNATILDVSGKNHPLPLYLNHHVPVTLSTDDEGVDRTNLTAQYEIAVSTFKFSYTTLKNLSRNAITYAFIPGNGLWQDDDYKHVNEACQKDKLGSEKISTACAAFLKNNEKANTQWELEKRFVKFETNIK